MKLVCRIVHRTKAVLLFGLALALAWPAAASDRVAQLSKIQGAVSITRSDSGDTDKARQVGPRVRNGSVFAGDVVMTDAASTATMVFSDGTQIDLKEGTSLSIQEVDLSSLVAQGKRKKPIGRTVKVLAGDIWTNVVPNPEVATEFETPSGVAAVKGTTFTISVGDDGEDEEE